MKQRINVFHKGQQAMNALYGLGIYLEKCSIEKHFVTGLTRKKKIFRKKIDNLF
jgi:hypothetical protein